MELLKKQEKGEKLSLGRIRQKLNEEQARYSKSFGDEEIKILPVWYIKNLETEEQLKRFLTHNKEIQRIGFFNSGSETFEIFEISRHKVYLDASNIAHYSENNNKHTVKFKNIKLVVVALKSKGFSDITVIADATLEHLASDPKVLVELKKDINYYKVPAHTEADEFLIKNAKQDECFIVTNDTFTDWKIKDRWIAEHIDNIRIPFMITEGRITFAKIDEFLGKSKYTR